MGFLVASGMVAAVLHADQAHERLQRPCNIWDIDVRDHDELCIDVAWVIKLNSATLHTCITYFKREMSCR